MTPPWMKASDLWGYALNFVKQTVLKRSLMHIHNLWVIIPWYGLGCWKSQFWRMGCSTAVLWYTCKKQSPSCRLTLFTPDKVHLHVQKSSCAVVFLASIPHNDDCLYLLYPAISLSTVISEQRNFRIFTVNNSPGKMFNNFKTVWHIFEFRYLIALMTSNFPRLPS